MLYGPAKKLLGRLPWRIVRKAAQHRDRPEIQVFTYGGGTGEGGSVISPSIDQIRELAGTGSYLLVVTPIGFQVYTVGSDDSITVPGYGEDPLRRLRLARLTDLCDAITAFKMDGAESGLEKVVDAD
jgi:hypothetical protein